MLCSTLTGFLGLSVVELQLRLLVFWYGKQSVREGLGKYFGAVTPHFIINTWC
jgi:hypothetical protein